MSPPPPFGLRSLFANTSYHLTAHTAPMMHRSHILATMSSYFGYPLRLSLNGPSLFTVDLVEYTCAEQFMMASKARLFGEDLALSMIIATDDPESNKRLGRQVRQFDHESWQQKCENIVLQGNLAKFSQNEDMRLALMHTGQRRLPRQSVGHRLERLRLPRLLYSTWRGSNLLGQALKHVRETLCSETMPQLFDSLPTDTTAPIDHPSGTVFAVDPITQTRLITAPITERTLTTLFFRPSWIRCPTTTHLRSS